MRALVVEDETVLREALRRDLAAAGFTVDLAADGEEGLFAGSEYPVDIALIDLGLPKLSGLDVIRRLRAATGQRVVARPFWTSTTSECRLTVGQMCQGRAYRMVPGGYSAARSVSSTRCSSLWPTSLASSKPSTMTRGCGISEPTDLCPKSKHKRFGNGRLVTRVRSAAAHR